MKKLNKNKQYKHLNQIQRDRIEALLNASHKQEEIAKILEIDKSTISREIKRNRRKTNNQYQAIAAQHKAYVRRKYAKYQGKKINENNELKQYIIDKLAKHWNPDEISGRMKNENQSFYASKTSIYEWLRSNYGQYWCQYLYSQRYRKKKRKNKKIKKALIPNRIGIELRPNGSVYGDYEADTMVSGKKHQSKHSLSVIYERKARYVKISKIKSLKPRLFNQSILKMKENLKIKTLTMDNGIENQYHQQLNINTYFCNPYSSWQKGGVENVIKMIRRFVLKGSDLKTYSHQHIRKIEHILNNKPRKSLNYKTPLEVMMENDLFISNKNTPEVALRG
jgi:IS30 family transposase